MFGGYVVAIIIIPVHVSDDFSPLGFVFVQSVDI